MVEERLEHVHRRLGRGDPLRLVIGRLEGGHLEPHELAVLEHRVEQVVELVRVEAAGRGHRGRKVLVIEHVEIEVHEDRRAIEGVLGGHERLDRARSDHCRRRLYGSEGAIICRLVEEHGICERLWLADKDHVEFKRAEIPAEFYPPGGSAEESWRTLFYANLVSSFITEILADDASNEGNFDDGAWVQETINAVERSFRERRWVTLPLA